MKIYGLTGDKILSQSSAVKLVLLYAIILLFLGILMITSDFMSPSFRIAYGEIFSESFRVTLGAVIGTLPFAFTKD